MNFSAIHIFTNEVQIIGCENPGKVKKSELLSLGNFIDSIILLKPGNVSLVDYQVINILNGASVKYVGIGSKPFSNNKYWTVKWVDLDLTPLDNLVSEIKSKLV